MRVVVDSDYLAYSAGFAVEKSRYDVAVLRPDNTEESRIFDTKDEAESWLLEEALGTQIVRSTLTEAEPLANALHLANRTLQAIEKALKPTQWLELYLTGKGNFRDSLATIKPYKGNRDPAHKPVHYKKLRRYLKERWRAVEVNGFEADDAVAMEAHKEGYDPARLVIVSVDKDLLTVPGGHYNFRTKELRTVTPAEALVNFYRQLITGDPTDNVGGAFKSGKKAAAIIAPDLTEERMYHITLDLYRRGLGVPGCPYANLSADDALLENARLLHMLRWPGDTWQPPGTRTGPGSSGALPGPSESPSSTSGSPSSSLSPPCGTVVPCATLPRSSATSPTPQTSSSPDGSSKPKGSSRRKTASSRSRSRSNTPPSVTPSSL